MSEELPITSSPSPQTLDRIAGCLVGAACADALGAPFEFGPPLRNDLPLEMSGGGAFDWKKGQFTDDAEMAIFIARLIASGEQLCAYGAFDKLVKDWSNWALTARDVGVQTRAVLKDLSAFTELEARDVAKAFHDANGGRSGGNGGLMRAFPIALAFPDDSQGLIEATRRSVELTHWEPAAHEAAVIWNLLIQNSYQTGTLERPEKLVALGGLDNREWWLKQFELAESSKPSDFHKTNGWVVHAIMAAWSAISNTDNYVDAVGMAVRGGGDTDTVGCITGALAGALYGFSAIPEAWRYPLNGLDGVDQHELVRLALSTPAAAEAGQEAAEWPFVEQMTQPSHRILVKHPRDEGLYLGNLAAIDMEDVEKVVLCRVGTQQVTYPIHTFWLVDQPNSNANLLFTMQDCVETVLKLREQGKTVLLLCQGGMSRTPSLAIAYAVWGLGVEFEEALSEVFKVLPHATPLEEFLETVYAQKLM